MSWQNDLHQQLDRLASGSNSTNGRIAVQGKDWQAEGEVADVGRIGCGVDWLHIRRNQPATESPAETGQRVAGRIGYLLEPLRVLEHDAESDTAQIRSATPSRKAGQAEYYELNIDRQETQFRRYQCRSGQPRQPVPANMTRETLERMIGDLAD